jgi:serine/threonine protein kinase
MDTDTELALALPGYSGWEQIDCSAKTIVYRAVRDRDRAPVAIKLLRCKDSTVSDLLAFRHQYAIAKNLKHPGIIRLYSLESDGNSYALIMEDFGGISLPAYIQARSLDWTEVLAIALQLADILDELYRHRIVHKDIKPAHILVHPDTKQVKLIDFSIASLLPKETQEIQNPNVLAGTLAYLSPEQTGRMNRGIDYRTDFYSLGVTLYQLLTGELPFLADDPLELVHCHIAQPLVAVHLRHPQVPLILSRIVSKLMAKNPEDRYQSALGLKRDLLECQQSWQQQGTMPEFPLGQRDVSDRFSIPEKLYGRESEVKLLLQDLRKASKCRVC